MIFTVVIGLGLLLVSYALVKSLIQYSKFKQIRNSTGVVGEYLPVIDLLGLRMKDVLNRNDGFIYYKELAAENPDLKACIGNIGIGVMLDLVGSEAIKEYLLHPEYYKKMVFSDTLDTLVGTGLVSADGEKWKAHRKILSGMFHYEFIRENIPVMVSTVRELLANLKGRPLDSVMIIDEMQKITAEIIGRIFFTENLCTYTMDGKSLTLVLAELLSETCLSMKEPFMVFLMVTGLSPKLSPSYHKLMKKILDFRALCTKLIEQRKASGVEYNDMLGLLLKNQKNPAGKEGTYAVYTDEDIINEFVTFFVAGMDTTGHLAAMVLLLLAQDPQHMEKIQKEVKEHYNSQDIPSIDALNNMEYTHAFIKEILRAYCPSTGTFPRVSQVDHVIDGIPVKKGTLIKSNLIYNHFNPKYYEKPMEFLPERWLDKTQKQDPFAYLAFSGGPRNCIGQHLTLVETKIIMAEFLNMFTYTVPSDYKIRMTVRFVHEPYDPIVMKLTPK